jgi:effector-binding domain-containing protein
MDPDIFDFEISVPVNKAVTAMGRVQPGELPARRVARTIYHGNYEGLGEAWGEFIDWIEAYGHQRAADLWECYTYGPESTSDETAYRTELNQPLLG